MELWKLASSLAELSPPAMLAVFIFALLRRWVILPRELDEANSRIEELKGERNEFKTLAFRALNVGERVATVVEDRGRDGS